MKNNLESNFDLGNLLFLIAYAPLLAMSSLFTSMYNQIIPNVYMNLILGISMGIFLLKTLVIDKNSPMEYFLFAGIGIVLLISTLRSGDKQLLILIAVCLMAKKINNNAIIRTYLIVSIAVLLFVYISTKIGKIPDLMYTRDLIIRHSYGIIYPTDFAAHVFYICCAYSFLRFEKYNIKDVLFLILTASILYRQTDARLNAGMIVALAMIIWIGKNGKINSIATKVWLVPALSFCFTYFSIKYYNSSSLFFNFLNKFFSGRLGIVQNIMNEYGLKVFGQKIIEHGWGGSGFYLNTNIFKYTYIDSTYMRLLIIYGILITFLFIVFISYLLKVNKNIKLILIIGLILLSGIIEQHFIDIAYNPFFIILVSDYFKKKGLLQCKNI
ncbi:hypothetical protein [Pediococcus pentosaceus]|uniref:hypothetical protein n=1 Tax=Pediococcus pentosaceus TaxID=1255 RepID=UPI00191A62A4|nr:hypothetical protein [Pediococcus pentosaceus]MCT3025555.1 hypothetical protein [Pediococcus pentosaceus]MDD1389830.1 hypothetical protein [Pediococcus pentosaceus]QQT98233.1 hypothetical protein I6I91_03890 [Pediococcus pentosaceus]